MNDTDRPNGGPNAPSDDGSQPGSVQADTAGLDDRLKHLSWLVLRQERSRGLSRTNPAADPGRGQGRILALLKMRDGISTKDLSYLLGIRTSSLNETLGKLERAGLVRREPSPEDRRVMLAKLTDQGRATEQHEVQPLGIYACLTVQEQATLCGYLDRLIAALEQEMGPHSAQEYERMMRARQRFAEGGPHGGHGRGRGRGWDGRPVPPMPAPPAPMPPAGGPDGDAYPFGGPAGPRGYDPREPWADGRGRRGTRRGR
jgi:DNA-binding MarR family transcriptional regulator